MEFKENVGLGTGIPMTQMTLKRHLGILNIQKCRHVLINLDMCLNQINQIKFATFVTGKLVSHRQTCFSPANPFLTGTLVGTCKSKYKIQLK